MGTAFSLAMFPSYPIWYTQYCTYMVIYSHFVQSIPIVLGSLGCVHVTISSTFYTLLFVLSESSLHLSYSLLVHSDSDISHALLSAAYSCSSWLRLLSFCSLTEE
ncbi:hypothetical protein C8Q74DRAFT_1289882 [Fomes fomentarius]|nr:hypothetical protein C8Q74DRAFT_1289875 [Fomes fomentarius]KAI0762375.1 hypothetical protein C8Q74DRAFT_1289882 [Fomes fomentarius]